MKKFTRLQRILLIANIVLLIFGCLMMGLRQNTLSNIGYSAWTYIKYGLIDYPITSLTNMFSDFANLWHAYDDNQYLNEQLAQQRSYKTLYEEQRNRNQELEELIEVNGTLDEATTVSASVLSRDTDAWDQTATISAGSTQGVEENMIVCTSQGAVGLVESVQTATSTVRLLTSDTLINDIAISISLDDGTNVEGVLESYDPDAHAYRVSLFDNDASVTQGQEVSTSGRGGNYPSGIYVGSIQDVETNDSALISTIYVSPVSNIGSFNYVLVIGSGALS